MQEKRSDVRKESVRRCAPPALYPRPEGRRFTATWLNSTEAFFFGASAMADRRMATGSDKAKPLLDLIERRFAIRLGTGSTEHLYSVYEHYRSKRELILFEYGEAGALARGDYAKSVLLSEAARMLILREIEPRPRKKKKN